MNTDNLCESCEYARIDEETGDLICDALLDEDEQYEFLTTSGKSCKFYKYFDEYRSVVHKQN